MKTYGGVEDASPSLSFSAVGGGEWLAIISMKQPIGFSDVADRRKTSYSYCESNSYFLVVQPVAWTLYRLRYPSSK
jgi:hypothetical protein